MEPTTFVLFGATGDLAKRKIYPALYNLFLDHKLPQPFSLVGLGRRELSDASFLAHVEQSLRTFSKREVGASEMKRFLDAFRYSVLNVDSKADYEKLRQLIEQREEELRMSQNRMFYLSVAPELFETIAANIQESGLGSANGWKRLVIEKPFGHDLQSARNLNQHLSKVFEEHEILRIDHYLGKPMVQQLEGLQQTNPVLEALFTNRYMANVQITASETVGVEERAGYYDHAGALRDMVQNHLLQMLMMLVINLPNHSVSDDVVRSEKKRMLGFLEPIKKQEVRDHVIRGQYKAGTVLGESVIGYRSEPGVVSASMNDTFVAARLRIDDFRWWGVPIYLRTGKRMKEKSTRIVIEFKEAFKGPTSMREENEAPNLLIFEISPNEGIALQLNTRDPKHKGEFKPVHMNFKASSDDVPEAYENLLDDALRGDHTFFAHWDEVELSWKWIQPILAAFEENLVPLHLYESGTYGPAESDALLAEDGYRWWLDAADEQEAETTEGESLCLSH